MRSLSPFSWGKIWETYGNIYIYIYGNISFRPYALLIFETGQYWNVMMTSMDSCFALHGEGIANNSLGSQSRCNLHSFTATRILYGPTPASVAHLPPVHGSPPGHSISFHASLASKVEGSVPYQCIPDAQRSQKIRIGHPGGVPWH